MEAQPIIIEIPDRSCDGCTKCCEGWLHGEAYSHKFWRGRKCHYLCNKKCSIYENRPPYPCRTFKCQWLINKNVPQWMKPDHVNAILVSRKNNGFEYLEVNEAGEKLKSEVLSWAIMYALQHKINLLYMLDGGFNRIGSEEFLKADLTSKETENSNDQSVEHTNA